MGKISEQKALEAYPICNCYNEQCMMQEDVNLESRIGYEEGYDQAMQDFLDKANEFFHEYFYVHPHDCCVVQYVSDTPLDDIDDFVEQFKKYMKDESEN